MNRFEFWRLTKFAFVGGLSAAAYFLFIFAAAPIITSTVALTAVAYAASAVLNYVLQRSFTFQSRLPHAVSFSRYIGMQTTALVVNSGLMFLLVDIAALNLYAAQLMVTTLVTIMNFLLSRFWVYAGQ
jgi:putative flippase GtrA